MESASNTYCWVIVLGSTIQYSVDNSLLAQLPFLRCRVRYEEPRFPFESIRNMRLFAYIPIGKKRVSFSLI